MDIANYRKRHLQGHTSRPAKYGASGYESQYEAADETDILSQADPLLTMTLDPANHSVRVPDGAPCKTVLYEKFKSIETSTNNIVRNATVLVHQTYGPSPLSYFATPYDYKSLRYSTGVGSPEGVLTWTANSGPCYTSAIMTHINALPDGQVLVPVDGTTVELGAESAMATLACRFSAYRCSLSMLEVSTSLLVIGGHAFSARVLDLADVRNYLTDDYSVLTENKSDYIAPRKLFSGPITTLGGPSMLSEDLHAPPHGGEGSETIWSSSAKAWPTGVTAVDLGTLRTATVPGSITVQVLYAGAHYPVTLVGESMTISAFAFNHQAFVDAGDAATARLRAYWKKYTTTDGSGPDQNTGSRSWAHQDICATIGSDMVIDLTARNNYRVPDVICIMIDEDALNMGLDVCMKVTDNRATLARDPTCLQVISGLPEDATLSRDTYLTIEGVNTRDKRDVAGGELPPTSLIPVRARVGAIRALYGDPNNPISYFPDGRLDHYLGAMKGQLTPESNVSMYSATNWKKVGRTALKFLKFGLGAASKLNPMVAAFAPAAESAMDGLRDSYLSAPFNGGVPSGY